MRRTGVSCRHTSGDQAEQGLNCSMNRVVSSASPPVCAMFFTPPRAGFFWVRRACATAWGWKSPAQPDGGEGLAQLSLFAVPALAMSLIFKDVDLKGLHYRA